ncbi:MAG: MATE family efflux transporter [Eubacteriales bacterium]
MNKNVNLLSGSIVGALTKLALPIMATSFLQTGYNLIDMIWIGRVGSDAVAAVGVGSMYVWFANGLITIIKIGGQVKVGQNLGAKREEDALVFAKGAFQIAVVAAIVWGILSVMFREVMVGFFLLDNQDIVRNAQIYIVITCGCIFFNYMNQIFTGIWTAIGNSKVTLLATLIGLSLNIVLDPVLIFGLGPFPELGVAGAALATVFAQFIVFVVFCVVSKKETIIYSKFTNVCSIEWGKIKEIVHIGFPAGIQSMMFTTISIILSRMITSFGDVAIAVQKVGTQVESISYMTAEGFATAINSFTAQNYGAKQQKRVNQGYMTAITIMILWGIFTSFMLIVFPAQIFRIFIQEEEMLQMGVDYLRIMGYSQIPMCVELATAGAFQGLGKTKPPSINSIILTGIRIPVAYFLCQTSLGLNGIWWTITLSALAKGIVLPILFMIERKKSPQLV